MIRDIVKDTEFLSKESVKFDLVKDKDVIQDLLDTAEAHRDECVGLAAVQIGKLVKAFVVQNPKTKKFVPYINPVIISKSPTKIKCVEGCLSLDGTREVLRHTWVTMLYTDRSGKIQKKTFSGFEAEVIQHEADHLAGKLI